MFGKFRYIFTRFVIQFTIPFAIFVFLYFFRLFQLGFIDIPSLSVKDSSFTAGFLGQNKLRRKLPEFISEG